jgi:hypothetical protein
VTLLGDERRLVAVLGLLMELQVFRRSASCLILDGGGCRVVSLGEDATIPFTMQEAYAMGLIPKMRSK